jgi:hypothetical protein
MYCTIDKRKVMDNYSSSAGGLDCVHSCKHALNSAYGLDTRIGTYVLVEG